MVKHHITKYEDATTGKKYATSWLQVNIFNKCYCLWKKEIEI